MASNPLLRHQLVGYRGCDVGASYGLLHVIYSKIPAAAVSRHEIAFSAVMELI